MRCCVPVLEPLFTQRCGGCHKDNLAGVCETRPRVSLQVRYYGQVNQAGLAWGGGRSDAAVRRKPYRHGANTQQHYLSQLVH